MELHHASFTVVRDYLCLDTVTDPIYRFVWLSPDCSPVKYLDRLLDKTMSRGERKRIVLASMLLRANR
jgi:hypothetical protein